MLPEGWGHELWCWDTQCRSRRISCISRSKSEQFLFWLGLILSIFLEATSFYSNQPNLWLFKNSNLWIWKILFRLDNLDITHNRTQGLFFVSMFKTSLRSILIIYILLSLFLLPGDNEGCVGTPWPPHESQMSWGCSCALAPPPLCKSQCV